MNRTALRRLSESDVVDRIQTNQLRRTIPHCPKRKGKSVVVHRLFQGVEGALRFWYRPDNSARMVTSLKLLCNVTLRFTETTCVPQVAASAHLPDIVDGAAQLRHDQLSDAHVLLRMRGNAVGIGQTRFVRVIMRLNHFTFSANTVCG